LGWLRDNNSQWDCWVHGGVGKDAFHYRLPGYETEALTDLFIKYIRERGAEQQAGKGKPFFAALSVQPPHNPYVAPEEHMRHFNGGQLQLRPNVPPVPSIVERARRELAGYYAQIENWDHNVGRISTALREAGLEFNTHIMLFSDHGDQHGSHGQFLKVSLYAEALSAPMLIGGEHPTYNGRLTGRPPALFNTVDIAPTTLGLCGIKMPDWMPGFNYSSRRIARSGRQGGEPDSAYLENRADWPPRQREPAFPRHCHARRLEICRFRGRAVPDVQSERRPLRDGEPGLQQPLSGGTA
jgi:arylsulfatase A-like enzyme